MIAINETQDIFFLTQLITNLVRYTNRYQQFRIFPNFFFNF